MNSHLFAHKILYVNHILPVKLGNIYPIAYAVKARVPGAPSNVNIRFKSQKIDEIDGQPQNTEPVIRKNFPESWIFDSINVDDNGNDTEEYDHFISFVERVDLICVVVGFTLHVPS